MHWQYSTLPYILQFVLALGGCIVAVVNYDRQRRPGAAAVAAIFAIAFVLPFFSDAILRHTPPSMARLADLLIANNRYGLLFYVVLTIAPWFYFWPQFYTWLTTAPPKAGKRK